MLAPRTRLASEPPLPPGSPNEAERLADPAAAATATARGASAEPALHDLRIVVVDDDRDSLDLMVTALRLFGGIVVGAPSAAEALVAIDENTPDIVVTDLVMPTVDGFELLGAIRQREEAIGRRIPTAALSARSTRETGQSALSAGFEMYVPKPIDPYELAFVVRLLAGEPKRDA
jgi:CheY-like chemotaxis protein